ncbi:hypothetical protein [Paenibacillus sp. KR2-11]|nr:hypothetical protein [Paenibacillus caseinilyticus]
MGTFDPESRWRDPQCAVLPAIADKDREAVVLCMDELLFPLCGPSDLLVTRCRMEEGLQAYLNGLGLLPGHRSMYESDEQIYASWSEGEFKRDIFELAAERPQALPPEALGGRLSPYAVTEGVEAYLSQTDGTTALPKLEVVKEVNSKLYSHRLLERIGQRTYGVQVDSAEALMLLGKQLLESGAFLIKDPFGVSGKGNLLIGSEGMLERIAAHLRKQESAGRRTEFLAEPFLDKRDDFSSQWFIGEGGENTLLSVQRMRNDGMNYGGSESADEPFRHWLEEQGYYGILQDALGHLYRDGYTGYVCFDSMVLQGGELVPIVEINARKSMGLINAALDRYLQGYGRQGMLLSVSLGLPQNFTFSRLMTGLAEAQLLYPDTKGFGMIPLSSGTVTVNRTLADFRTASGTAPKGTLSLPKGRLYVTLVGKDAVHRAELSSRLRQLLTHLSLKVYN